MISGIQSVNIMMRPPEELPAFPAPASAKRGMNEINMEWTFLIFLSPENNNRISRRSAGSAMSCLHNRESLCEQAARKETYEIRWASALPRALITSNSPGIPAKPMQDV